MPSFQLTLVAALLGAAATSESVPSLEAMAGDWLDLTKPVSAHVNASHLDLPIISNFHGSCGSSPNGDWGLAKAKGGVSPGHVTPVDLFALNSLEVPPFAGCGNSAAHGTPNGCGRLLLDGQQLAATSTRYRADEVARRATTASGLAVDSRMRMLFEKGGVMWQVNISNSGSAAVSADVQFELSAMVTEYAHVAWVQSLPFDPRNFTYTQQTVVAASRGVLSVGKSFLHTDTTRPAASLIAFVGEAPAFDLGSAIPTATFKQLAVAPKSTRTIRMIMTIGKSGAEATALAAAAAATPAAFAAAWSAASSKWEERWQSAFDDKDSFFTGSMPTLDLEDSGDVEEAAEAADAARVYYASVLSIVSQMRTNLPLMYGKVWPTSQGSSEALKQGGVVIGGAISYFWDEALSSMLLAMLEPAGRAPTMQAWFTADLRGKKHNWFDLDCGPDNPVGTVYGACNWTGVAPHKKSGKNVYPYNIWSYGLNIFNYLRTSNDTGFLAAQAAKSNLTVDEALEEIVLDWQGTVVPGTRLADYGTNLDGFSRTYEHVMPGMQGNNIWMVRQLARLRELQGDSQKAAYLRKEAKAMADESIKTMFGTSKNGKHAWWNVLWPTGKNGTKPLEAHEMRHVVDWFSMAFGLCGVSGVECDLSTQQRAQLAAFVKEELKTVDWIRATSPACNCNNTHAVPDGHTSSSASASPSTSDDKWPALVTCKADREDHGTTGAYTAWPAAMVEGLCYIEGNCSSAFRFLASFAPNTRQGALGQANAVPQQTDSPPYTPHNNEPAYKPSDRRYLNMAVGAFADAVVRGLFGYHPPPVWPSEFSQAALDSALLPAKGSRGFKGKLRNLRTPFGLATISSDAAGLSIRLQKK